jgi:hypothetical protein
MGPLSLCTNTFSSAFNPFQQQVWEAFDRH